MGSAAFFEILLWAVSKHVLKRSKKSWTFSAQIDLSAQIYFFNELLPLGGRLSDEAYNVFTKKENPAHIYFFNEPLPPEGDFSAQIYFFHELLPPEGDFSAQIYFFNELLPPEGDFSAQIYFFNELFTKIRSL